MSSSGYDLGPAVDSGQGYEASNLGDTTATVMARLDVALNDMPGVTILDKLDTLMSKFAAAKELLGGLEPDILLQALNTVDEPDRELFKSSTLVNAYEHISKNGHVDAPEEEASGDELATAIMAALAAVDESETSQEQTHPQEPPLHDTQRVLQPPRVQPLENNSRQSNPAQQEAISESPTPQTDSRPKQTPRWYTRCSKEERYILSPAGKGPCTRKACNFLHEDQHAYMVNGLYQKDVSTGKIQAWDLKPYTNRAGHNTGIEKAGKNDQNFDAFLKKLKNKDKVSETKAKEEYAQKKKKTKSALEAKAAAETAEKSKKAAVDAEATTKVLPKKRKVAASSAAKGTAEHPVKKSKGSEADR
ncbi:hypothetical protein BKA58DRAFT_443274 [Alternaria rosae]|uniref:uncharacterized protein n=1 Tax=Alternaria rosae TaxID=1187941 RepID=UPI001E8E77FA|nr:uncharacterized protein BKA58DRAFT_443274 [Alternaria rosae]KAH6865215.1 hypothetical protein BKA58DRAFT_443274 [Alternaria rosae]